MQLQDIVVGKKVDVFLTYGNIIKYDNDKAKLWMRLLHPLYLDGIWEGQGQ